MNIFTSGYELSTSITNIFIFVIGLYGSIKIKHDKLWKLFFILMSIDSFLGVVVHGLVMSDNVNNILWGIMSIIFAVTVNTLLGIFLKYNYKHIIVLSVLLCILLLSQLVFDMNYIFTFTMYVLLIVLITFIYIFVNNYNSKKWFVMGYIILVIGGILMLSKAKINVLNHNGICHLFIAVTLILFYIGVNNNNELCYNLNSGE